jgi:hypothetical protein
VCRFVGTVPDIWDLVWLSFRPKSGSKSKISGQILQSFRGPFSRAEINMARLFRRIFRPPWSREAPETPGTGPIQNLALRFCLKSSSFVIPWAEVREDKQMNPAPDFSVDFRHSGA